MMDVVELRLDKRKGAKTQRRKKNYFLFIASLRLGVFALKMTGG